MSEELVPYSDGCRRHGERRQINLRSMFYALFMSRRVGTRRRDESHGYYSDYYNSFVFTAAIILMLLCILDAYFTLLLIQYGSTELNPVLAWALNKHVLFFFILKYILTAIFVVLTVVHKHFRVFGLRGYQVLILCILSYGILVQYQLRMLLPAMFLN